MYITQKVKDIISLIFLCSLHANTREANPRIQVVKNIVHLLMLLVLKYLVPQTY